MSTRREILARLRPARDALLRRIFRLPQPLRRRLAGAPLTIDGNTLDLDTQLLLRMAERLHKPAGSEPLDEARPAFDADSDSVGPEPRAMRLVEDRDLGGGVTGRLYVPVGLGARRPLVLYFHGGGFTLGSVASHDRLCRVLADEIRAVVLSVGYRLAPEHPFPRPLEDVVRVYEIALERAATELGASGELVAVAGDSAGGNLAAVLCMEARARKLPQPAAQLLIYPATDFTLSMESHRTFGHGYFLEHESILFYRAQYAPREEQWRDPRVSPHFADDLSGLAPAIVHTAGFDPLRDEGDAYAERLRDAGVPTTHVCHGPLVHGYANMGVLSACLEATLVGAHQLRDALRAAKA